MLCLISLIFCSTRTLTFLFNEFINVFVHRGHLRFCSKRSLSFHSMMLLTKSLVLPLIFCSTKVITFLSSPLTFCPRSSSTSCSTRSFLFNNVTDAPANEVINLPFNKVFNFLFHETINSLIYEVIKTIFNEIIKHAYQSSHYLSVWTRPLAPFNEDINILFNEIVNLRSLRSWRSTPVSGSTKGGRCTKRPFKPCD